MRRLWVEALAAPGERVPLGPTSSHHALRVLRLPRGAEVVVFDGTGRQARASLVDVTDGAALVEVIGPATTAAPAHPLHLVLGLLKGPAMDLAVRMATEAGATDIHVVQAARSVARGDRADRWARIAASAAQQCGRADIPRVHPVVALADALGALPALDLRVAVPGAPRLEPATGPAAICVGPEGGFTDAELACLLERGARPAGLGSWVLRADTAVAVAVASTASDPE